LITQLYETRKGFDFPVKQLRVLLGLVWKSIHHKGHEEHEEKNILPQRTQKDLDLRSVR
jgi:hypothetical protein